MNETPKTLPWTHPFSVADLPGKRATDFLITPDVDLKKQIAVDLQLAGVRKLVFSGEITANGKSDWLLKGKLGATVIQYCIITLERVTTRIDEDIQRTYTAAEPEYETGSELEMPQDESIEELGDTIDPGMVMVEALTLSLPQFPRSPNAALNETIFTEPGKSPMSDAQARPFSGLSGLRSKLNNDDDQKG